MNYNPFTYRGYYHDHESRLYYLINIYYSPDIEMFITPDSFNYLDPSTLYGLDLYTYCMFNPIMYVDPEGNNLRDILKKIHDWFQENFDSFIEVTSKTISQTCDYLFFGFEAGEKETTYLYDDNKLFSLFYKKPLQWFDILNHEVGYRMKIKNSSFSFSLNLKESNYVFEDGKNSLTFTLGADKIGVEISKTIDEKTTYAQYYLRTPPTLAFVAVLVFCPEVIIKLLEYGVPLQQFLRRLAV